MPTYARADLAFVRGEGAYLFTDDGRRFLDFGSGIAVAILGHCHPHLVQAVQAQAARLWHTSNLYHIPEQTRLAERLVANTFADTVFFCNSGAEAVEGSLKVVRKYQHDTGHPERYRVITFANAFHGRTLATISAAGRSKYLKGFEPAVDGFDQVSFRSLNEARTAISDTTAGILVEPIQGEGGIIEAEVEFLQGLRAMADEYGLLLALDEVQTGMGRTGKLFAHEAASVRPDVMAVAKGLAGGFPIGAVLATEKAAQGMTAGTHGSTFGGNPLAMAAANATLDVVLGKGFLDSVVTTGRALRGRLDGLVARHPKVFEGVRGRGLMLGLKCVGSSGDFVERLYRHGLLTVPAADNVVRLLPPLIIGAAEIDEALTKLAQAAGEAV
ncbi:MAG: aspartate aminotransferase family protein [Alphaproteobacteria bacterium]|nr:aspartate aminotransferase family protein [Alphaproteobacteria bacterium]